MGLEVIICLMIVAAVGMIVTGVATDDKYTERPVDGDEFDNGGNNCA